MNEFRALRAFGFIYYEVYEVGATHFAVGWITRLSFAHPYECWYCDGKRKASATRGSQKNARAWLLAEVALTPPVAPVAQVAIAKSTLGKIAIVRPSLQPLEHFVFATREGLIGQTTASGYVIDEKRSFVALPSTKALKRVVRVRANYKETLAEVLDVGPHLEHDDAYVFGSQAPLAAAGWHTVGGAVVKGWTNGAGIDLGQAVWKALGMTDNGTVEWEFV
jgi:hypothetical protein